MRLTRVHIYPECTSDQNAQPIYPATLTKWAALLWCERRLPESGALPLASGLRHTGQCTRNTWSNKSRVVSPSGGDQPSAGAVSLAGRMSLDLHVLQRAAALALLVFVVQRVAR